MTDSKQKKSTENSEIDLIDLFNRFARNLKSWFFALWHIFLTSVFFIIRKWIPLTISVFAGILIAYIMSKSAPSIFTSDLILRNNLASIDNLTKRDASGTTADIIQKYNRLHSFCEENNKPALIDALQITKETALEISDIQALWIIDQNKDGTPDYTDYRNNHNIYDTTNIRMPDRLAVHVLISKSEDLQMLQDKLVEYINEDPLIKGRNKIRINQRNELIARYIKDINLLDSLQKVKYFEETRSKLPEGGGQMVFLQENKTQLVYDDIYDLYGRKQTLETELALHSQALTIMSEFTPPVKRVNNTIYFAKRYVVVLFLLTLLTLILIENRKRLSDLAKKY